MPTEDAITLMADAGFDAIDFSFHVKPEYYDESTDGELGKEKFLKWKALADSKGIVFNHN